MSRIRTIKPEFWASEQVISCSPLARLLFIGIWNFSDDNGVHPASCVRIKAEVFPCDGFIRSEIESFISELIANDLLREYIVDEKAYWIVTGWAKHQRIDKPTYRHPLPLSGIKRIEDNSTSTPRIFDDKSSSTLRVVADNSLTDRNGVESNGKEKDICEVKTSPCFDSKSQLTDDINIIFAYWQNVMAHPRAKLDNKRRGKILQALKLGYSMEALKKAIDGCAANPFNMGDNDRRQRYDDLELILRDASHIDRFINNADKPSSSLKQGSDIMAGVI